jgi:ABC-type lipoprotein export system ATPase subunit
MKRRGFGARGRPPAGAPPTRPPRAGEVQAAGPRSRVAYRPDLSSASPDVGAQETLVRFRHVHKIYRIADTGVVALGGVDLDIDTGEFLAVVGPSGSGKSTILNLAGGLDRASAGEVLVAGRDLGRMDDEELTRYRRDEVGFVWQGTARNLVPYLRLRENVGLPLLARSQRGWTRRRIDELLEVVGLADRARHRPGELSGGEQQRAAIAVALANLPSLLLADEPTAELDSESSERVLAAFRDVNREFRSTIVMVTHDLVAANRADRIVRVRDGRLARESVVIDGLGQDGRVRLPDRAVEALWGGELEAEVQDDEVRLRRRHERTRGPDRG